MTLADLLGSWTERLCRLPEGGPAAAAEALGLSGTLVDTFGATVVQPSPPGISELRLVEAVRGGALDHVDLALDGGTLTRADLDTCFGPGHDLPRVHFGDPFPVAYRVEVPGAPSTCALIARFDEKPTGASVATRIVLRPDRA